ncbi:unnamed protein product [Camellia sinensis]
MFDPRTELPNNHVHPFNPTPHIYDHLGKMNYDARARKTAQKYENYRSRNGMEVQFRPENMGEDESGVFSPPLWKSSPPRSPTHTRHPQNNYRSLSPNSRAQAIARGQWELMEMVKTMPESCYELSLKDIVDHPTRVMESEEECLVGEKSFGREDLSQRVKVVKRQESNKNESKGKVTMRSTSFDNGGFLLKMVFPFSFGLKKKKKNLSTNGLGSKVSPKPDKEWCKKRSFGSSETVAGAVRSNSGSSGSSGSRNSSRSNSNSSRSRGTVVGHLVAGPSSSPIKTKKVQSE